MKVSFKLLIGYFISIVLEMIAQPVMVDHHRPGKGGTVKPARAIWNTGFFQEAMVRRGLETRGYKVKTPKDLQNPIYL